MLLTQQSHLREFDLKEVGYITVVRGFSDGIDNHTWPQLRITDCHGSVGVDHWMMVVSTIIRMKIIFTVFIIRNDI